MYGTNAVEDKGRPSENNQERCLLTPPTSDHTHLHFSNQLAAFTIFIVTHSLYTPMFTTIVVVFSSSQETKFCTTKLCRALYNAGAKNAHSSNYCLMKLYIKAP